MEEYLLAFELTKGSKELEIHGNREGLENLRRGIDFLLAKSKQDHAHLFTPSWGGDDLTEEPQAEHHTILNMVTIYFWPE